MNKMNISFSNPDLKPTLSSLIGDVNMYISVRNELTAIPLCF